jgi:hypothetical protein
MVKGKKMKSFRPLPVSCGAKSAFSVSSTFFGAEVTKGQAVIQKIGVSKRCLGGVLRGVVQKNIFSDKRFTEDFCCVSS